MSIRRMLKYDNDLQLQIYRLRLLLASLLYSSSDVSKSSLTISASLAALSYSSHFFHKASSLRALMSTNISGVSRSPSSIDIGARLEQSCW